MLLPVDAEKVPCVFACSLKKAQPEKEAGETEQRGLLALSERSDGERQMSMPLTLETTQRSLAQLTAPSAPRSFGLTCVYITLLSPYIE